MADFGNEGLAELYRRPGSASTVYVDVTQDREDPRRTSSLRHRSVREALADAGAPEADADIVIDRIEEPPGRPGKVSRLLVVRDGLIELDELLPGEPLGELIVSHGPVPCLLPLLIQRPRDLTYIIAEVGRDGGEIRQFRLSRTGAVAEEEIEGDTEYITKVQGGFLSNSRYQRDTEEIWKRNEGQIADAIDEMVRTSGAELLMLTGDVRARQLLVAQLAPASRDILAVVPTNTRPGGATTDELEADLDRHLAAILAQDEYDALERLDTGRDEGLAEADFAAVVRELQQGQVEVLLLASGALPEATLLALDREPWVASTEADALGAAVLGAVPAADALVRAALLTDARVVVVSPGELPGGSGAAALLRWSTLSTH
ncbi:Vms1/Ankzf1 family peptidyl-tRNA hydrolase [Cryobacterium sp. 10I1]|uniref:baeRF2 domain-containing protein n=2 Tax=Bacteria TaxID=2 RepID=UPI002AC8B37D|nr:MULTISPECIES: Vms1/Ankzf1 family peptidyl-tRNA hydrolase [unclassified Cryobacterium]MEB0003126.1 Vms1/Ankzf1 family peptidyl-tRNA hydrolase [Cryobacterium sp. RTC2.1]MEB0287907.1 Vms1/Ankzf1 family peptidyl-tRNA hydrolase [Cryobacterium sp. 10S3]MEB0307406.1 Vms1/Ankzf1 family peptidyl-tRNA hydrolase [Cryobacterium sp. 10I1]WPX13632.1 Vms1/Ankzf1 family peptidyl-tRNA hydrolase [Cryobacterium sp. 10S3]